MKVFDNRKLGAGQPSDVVEGNILKIDTWGNSYHDIRVFLDTGYVIDFEFAGTDEIKKFVTEQLQTEVLKRMTKGGKKNG